MKNKVVIDCFPESAAAYGPGYAVVAIDVIRATTSAITVAARGGRCFPVPSTDAAKTLASRLANPILAGEVGGDVPMGFEMNNSPADFDSCADLARPVILLSSSGTKLLHEARHADAVYLASFRNYSYMARHLVDHHSQIAVIGAGSRNEFREEDQMCCAWITRGLIDEGYVPGNDKTMEIVRQWRVEEPSAITAGKSAAYLRRSGQTKDLDFILAHVNDLSAAFVMKNGEVAMIPAEDVRSGAPLNAPAGVRRTALEIC